MFLNFDITHIPEDVKSLAAKAANVTTTIEKDLAGGIVTDIAALIPGGTQLQTDLQNVCKVALSALNALSGLADKTAQSAVLQRLGSDITKLEHKSDKHTISFYITCFEIVYHDLFGSPMA